MKEHSVKSSLPQWTRVRPVLLVAITLALTVIAAVAAVTVAEAGPVSRPKPVTGYQVQLRSEVDAANGAPRSGRDPAALKQTSLAAAAAKPVGNGDRASKPARNATRDHAHDAMPGDMLMDPKTSGELDSGCATGYGQPGAQCLPVKGPNGAKLTCAYVVKIFPHGVVVLGADRLKLDANHDKIACGPGDPV
jgi:hypothetical protein